MGLRLIILLAGIAISRLSFGICTNAASIHHILCTLRILAAANSAEGRANAVKVVPGVRDVTNTVFETGDEVFRQANRIVNCQFEAFGFTSVQAPDLFNPGPE